MIDIDRCMNWWKNHRAEYKCNMSEFRGQDAEEELINTLYAEVKRLRFHLKDVVDELATHLGDYENEMYDWIRKMHELYGSD